MQILALAQTLRIILMLYTQETQINYNLFYTFLSASGEMRSLLETAQMPCLDTV